MSKIKKKVCCSNIQFHSCIKATHDVSISLFTFLCAQLGMLWGLIRYCSQSIK